MGENIIDNKIRNKVFDHPTFIDNDQLWDAIQGKEKKRNKYFWLLSLIPILLIGSYFILTTENNNEIIDQKSIVLNNEKALMNTPKNESEIKTPNEIKTAITSHTTTKSENKEEVTSTTLSSIKTKTASSKKTQLQDVRKTITNSNTKEKTTSSKQKNSSNTNIQNVDTPLKNKTNFTYQKKAFTPSINTASSQKSASAIQLIDVQSLMLIDPQIKYSKNYSPFISKRKLNKIECYNHSQKRNPISFFVYAGPEYVARSLSSTGIANDEYLESRNNTEKVLEGTRAGLLLKYGHKSGLYFKSGIEYQRINEKLDYSEVKDSTFVLPNEIIGWTINTAGDTTFERGPMTAHLIETKSWKIYNSFSYINVPLLLGYEVENKKWSYGIELGATINARLNFNGAVLSPPNTEGTSTQVRNPDYYKSSTGLSLNLGAGIGHYLTPDMKLWLTPSIKHGLSDVNRLSYPINQRYTTVGLIAGLELKF